MERVKVVSKKKKKLENTRSLPDIVEIVVDVNENGITVCRDYGDRRYKLNVPVPFSKNPSQEEIDLAHQWIDFAIVMTGVAEYNRSYIPMPLESAIKERGVIVGEVHESIKQTSGGKK